MIDANKTIYASLIDKIQRLRYQAQDSPKDFKSILRAIILTDILEWSAGLDLPQSLQEKLKQKQIDLFLCDPAFKVQYADTSTAYVNVNTPQTNSTWKRVWDSPNVTEVNKGDIGQCSDEFCIPAWFEIVEMEVKEFDSNQHQLYTLQNIIEVKEL